MNKVTDYKRNLIRQYHTLCTINGLSVAEKEALMEGFGVKSSLELSEVQLSFIIDKLKQEGNTWRKRVIASIGAWLRSISKEQNINLIKGIACRCAQNDDFNKIPVSRLRNIYYEFTKKAKAVGQISQVMDEELKDLILLN